jgi:hypothetical protein
MDILLRPPRTSATLTVTAALLLVTAPSVLATSASDTSDPRGHFTTRASIASTTDRDGDANPDTATVGDQVSAYHVVRNNTDRSRTVTITLALDAPGAAYDVSYSERRTIAPRSRVRRAIDYTVTADFPRGTYVATVAAVGSETARVAVSLTIH